MVIYKTYNLGEIFLESEKTDPLSCFVFPGDNCLIRKILGGQSAGAVANKIGSSNNFV